MNLAWIELDLYDVDALLQIKQATRTPICSLETLFYGVSYLRNEVTLSVER